MAGNVETSQLLADALLDAAPVRLAPAAPAAQPATPASGAEAEAIRRRLEKLGYL